MYCYIRNTQSNDLSNFLICCELEHASTEPWGGAYRLGHSMVQLRALPSCLVWDCRSYMLACPFLTPRVLHTRVLHTRLAHTHLHTHDGNLPIAFQALTAHAPRIVCTTQALLVLLHSSFAAQPSRAVMTPEISVRVQTLFKENLQPTLDYWHGLQAKNGGQKLSMQHFFKTVNLNLKSRFVGLWGIRNGKVRGVDFTCTVYLHKRSQNFAWIFPTCVMCGIHFWPNNKVRHVGARQDRLQHCVQLVHSNYK